MRYILYARKSSEGNERQAQSIPDQKAVLMRLAKDLGLNVVYELDEAKSAKRPGTRPVFARMIELIQGGKADAILCWHLNRLSRNPIDAGTLSWLLQEGIIKCIKTPHREYRPEDNVLMMAFENGDANQYIRELRENVRRGQDRKAERGWYPYRPRVGYLTNRENGEIEADPVRFPMMRRVWELMLSGAYTVPEALDKLNGWGYRSARRGRALGGKMARSCLYSVLSDPFYCGEFTYRGKVYQGKHKPMITREEFEQVQCVIHRTDHIQPQKHRFAFTGLIRCGTCGCLVTAERKVKRYISTGRTATYTYYHCTGSKGCPKNSVSEDWLEGQIGLLLNQCSLNAEASAWAAKAVLRDESESPCEADQVLSAHEKDLDQLEKKLSGLYDMRLGQEISAEEFTSLRTKYQAETARLKLAIERLRRWKERRKQSVINLMSFATSAASHFSTHGEKIKREVAAVMADQYLLTLGKLSFSLNPLLVPLVTFERPPQVRHKVCSKNMLSPCPSLWAMVDSIRTLLQDENVSFPKLLCLEQARTAHSETSDVASME